MRKKVEKNDEENYGGVANTLLSFFGITEDHMDLVKSVLDSVKKTETPTSTTYDISLKNIKITISK